jgi:hypothetical protein
MKFFAAGLMLICSLHGICAAAEVTGTVRSKAGKPLAGVVVSSRCRGAAETDAAGSFKLRAPSMADCGKVVFFSAAGFLPQVKVVDEGTREIHAVLEESTGREQILRSCSAIRPPERRLGWMLRVSVPRGASVKKSRDPHGSGWVIRSRGKRGRAELEGYGGAVGYNYPSDDLILSAAELTIRLWRSGRNEGEDFRGRAPDGKHWRYVALSVEYVTYSAATDEEADDLDRIIDGACFQP